MLSDPLGNMLMSSPKRTWKSKRRKLPPSKARAGSLDEKKLADQAPRKTNGNPPAEKNLASSSSGDAPKVQAKSPARIAKLPVKPASAPSPKLPLSSPAPKECGRFDAFLKPTHPIVALCPTYIFRPVDFRWQLGLYLAAGEPVPVPWLEEAIFQAAEFSMDVARCRTVVDCLRLAQSDPEMFEAVEVWQAGGGMRSEVEARILANESPETIAQMMAMPPKSIAWIAKWFYAVQDRLQYPGYIVDQVIQWNRDGQPDMAKIQRYYAYFGGKVVLDAIIGCSPYSARSEPVTSPVAFATEQVESDLQLKAMIASKSLPVTGKNAGKLVKVMIERNAKVKKEPENVLFANFHENLDVAFEFFKPRQPHPLEGKLPPPLRNQIAETQAEDKSPKSEDGEVVQLANNDVGKGG